MRPTTTNLDAWVTHERFADFMRACHPSLSDYALAFCADEMDAELAAMAATFGVVFHKRIAILPSADARHVFSLLAQMGTTAEACGGTASVAITADLALVTFEEVRA